MPMLYFSLPRQFVVGLQRCVVYMIAGFSYQKVATKFSVRIVFSSTTHVKTPRSNLSILTYIVIHIWYYKKKLTRIHLKKDLSPKYLYIQILVWQYMAR